MDCSCFQVTVAVDFTPDQRLCHGLAIGGYLARHCGISFLWLPESARIRDRRWAGNRRKKIGMDLELESFKSRIDLRAYAAAQGYQLDRKESWRGSSVMRHPNGDKVIIKRRDNGHYLYFSVRNDEDNGSIIDFVQHRQHLSLGTVRKELRPWLGAPPVAVPDFPALPKMAKDRMRVETEYARMQKADRHAYLESERGIPAALLESERFAGRVRIDARGNAVFPHFDTEGLCGYEIKNAGFTGFAAGGTKGLWFSHTRADDNRLVICEGAIDALSHATLFPDEHARYASIGGQVSPLQPELIRAAAARMLVGAEIVAAMDADANGARLADVVKDAVRLVGRDDLRFILQEPTGFKDWNDHLRARRGASSLPIAHSTGLQAG
jgi:Toprim-like/Protein of unknown function (DUF3991)